MTVANDSNPPIQTGQSGDPTTGITQQIVTSPGEVSQKSESDFDLGFDDVAVGSEDTSTPVQNAEEFSLDVPGQQEQPSADFNLDF